MTVRLAMAIWLVVMAPMAGAAHLIFENAWIRAPAPGQTIAAGYCDIINDGSEAAVIVGFTGPRRVEMHETTDEHGMVRMRPLQRLTVAAGATVSLAPGGKHLMLFDFNPGAGAAPMAWGNGDPQVTLWAVFDDGERLPVVFKVRPLGADALESGETRRRGVGR